MRKKVTVVGCGMVGGTTAQRLAERGYADIVMVASTGPLFGPGGERGIYRTTDGGKTWARTLSVDDETGANDLAISRSEPNVVWAMAFMRLVC